MRLHRPFVVGAERQQPGDADHAHYVVQRLQRDVPGVLPADPHDALVRVVQPCRQGGDRGLPRARRPDQRGQLAGWRKEEVYDHGNISLWAKEGILPAHETQFGTRPTPVEGLLWGTVPIGSSILAVFLVLALSDRRRRASTIEFPSIAETEPVLREAR